ncbi:MAG: type 4a pilus biogenesis protein PilO [Acidimicrobiia bacterium]|nr:type 4a pilus biogenesis protein PilO [Acidimicrobiia bacterium]
MKTKALSIVGVLVALIIALAWFMFLYKPASDKLGKVNTEIEDAKAEEITLQGELASLKELAAQEATIDSSLASLQQAAPDVADEQGLIAALQKTAYDNNVELSSVTVSEPTPGGDISTLSFQLEASGSFRDVTNFFAALLDPAVMPRVVTFDQMQVTPAETGTGDGPTINIVSVSLSGRAFTTEGAGAAPTQGAAPTEAGATATAPSGQ